MRKRLLLMAVTLLLAFLHAQTAKASVEINEENFPDANFRAWLMAQDYGQDGVLSYWEIQYQIIDINVSEKGIKSLKGIEFFTALTKLYCSKNQQTALDVSKNTALIELYCSENQLTTLDVSGCTALTWLGCNNNQLTALDVSGCTALTVLDCYENQLTALDVSKNTALKSLDCYENHLTALDMSKNTALIGLDCYENQLTALDVSKNTALIGLYCSDNQLTALDVSKNTALIELYCSENQLTTLDVSNNTVLTRLSCDNNHLTALDVSKNTELTRLYCYDNQLTALDMSNNTALEELYCYENQLTALDVSGCVMLFDLECYKNQLTTLDVSKNTALTWLGCYGNHIRNEGMDDLIESLPNQKRAYLYVYVEDYETMEMTGPDSNLCTKDQVAVAKEKGWMVLYHNHTDDKWQEYEGYAEPVEDITINEENFPDANFRTWLMWQEYGQDGVLTDREIQDITEINVSCKGIKSLKGIEYFTTLEVLKCWGNWLTALDVSKNTALKSLDCGDNQLTELDVSKNTMLTSLSCYYNQLTALDVSKNTALTLLDCSSNQLMTLDVSKNTALTYLLCSSNQLAVLDVSKNTALQMLHCCDNQFSGEAMDDLIESLPNQWAYLYVYVEDYETMEMTGPDGNVCTKEQVAAAKAKGWTVYYYTDGEWKEYEGAEVGIDIIRTSEKDGPWYDLSGRKLEGKPKSKGIYIINGKKTLVK